MCTKGKKGVIEILRTMKRLNSVDMALFWKLFDTQIEPVLTYAAEIWGLLNNTFMEQIHTYAIKRIMKVPLHASNKMVYGETGRYPLYIRTYVKSIKYWLRLIKLPPTRISRQAYEMLLLQHETGRCNWVSCIKKVLAENGFGIVWLNQGVGSETQFISEFKDRLICCYRQTCHARMDGNYKYDWFMSFKNNFEVEQYLMIVTHTWHRCNLSTFRTRTLGLNANRRWFEVSDNKACFMCAGTDNTENETHFVFDCPAYAEIRRKCKIFSEPIVQRRDLTLILSTTNNEIILSFPKFIAEASDLRK
eukprot:TRINITY_DN23886_c1_g1_i4.p1 TRINITY_DN23886_c1_g1~~TRINITY_DN23886_c1_g1_i4.p1  ORF type:complete len:305 (+),score=12.69 TRINITY_DN23886_c1_g1_i4:54-968(+)